MRPPEEFVRMYPDFPQSGVNFLDFSPLLADPKAFAELAEWHARQLPDTVDAIVGVESRGFILATAIAQAAKKPFIMARKFGKLPGSCVSASCDIEYAKGVRFELARDAVTPFSTFWIVDDVLATGGTAVAVASMLRELGKCVAGFGFLLEIEPLGGRHRLLDQCAAAKCETRYRV